MKKVALLVAVLLAFSFTALAQNAGTSGAQSSESTTTKTTKKTKKAAGEAGAVKEHTITGCLAKDPEGNGYILTNGRYKKGLEVKSSEDFSAHVGHEVKLTGTMEKPTAGGEGGAGEKGATMRTFNASKLTHISDTCPAAGAKAGKKGKAKTAGTASK